MKHFSEEETRERKFSFTWCNNHCTIADEFVGNRSPTKENLPEKISGNMIWSFLLPIQDDVELVETTNSSTKNVELRFLFFLLYFHSF